MSNSQPVRAHAITGGFPVGSPAGHDMDYARLRILQLLHEQPNVTASVSGDFTDIDKWLPGCQLLVTYVAGPFPNEAQNRFLRQWLEDGGRWLGLHGTSGGKAAPVGNDRRVRKMVKADHHATLGGFFLNHPPLRKFQVDVVNQQHSLTRGLPASFEVMDELYLIELQEPENSDILLTTELEKDPSPPGFGFVYDEDTACNRMEKRGCWALPEHWAGEGSPILRWDTAIQQPAICSRLLMRVSMVPAQRLGSFAARGTPGRLNNCSATESSGAVATVPDADGRDTSSIFT